MANILVYSAKAYVSHIRFLLLFSIPFIIAVLIPLLAPMPSYNDMGAIFLRSAGIFSNLNISTIAIILFSTLFSILFLSFAIVAINVVVKHERIHRRISSEVIKGLEDYTGKVFTLLLIFTLIPLLVSLLALNYGFSGIFSVIAGLAVTPLFFYAPSSVVIDEYGIVRAMKASASFFVRYFKYFAIWFAIALAFLLLLEGVLVAVQNPIFSYAVLFLNCIFLMPFLSVLQSESYLRKFSLLKH